MSRIESLLSRIVSALGKSPRTTLRKIVLTIQRLGKWAIEALQEHSNILSWLPFFTITYSQKSKLANSSFQGITRGFNSNRTNSVKIHGAIEYLAPGEGFEPSRPQRTTGFVCSIPGLGSSTWDLPRTRLGNPGVSQPRLSTAVQLPLNRHKDSHGKMI